LILYEALDASLLLLQTSLLTTAKEASPMPKAFDISCRYPHGDLIYNFDNEYVATRDYKGPIHITKLNPDEEITGWLVDGVGDEPRLLLSGKPFEVYHNITTKMALCEQEEGISGILVVLADRLIGYFVEQPQVQGQLSEYVRFTWILAEDTFEYKNYIVNAVNKATSRLRAGLKKPEAAVSTRS
jgi:hypothetical protein